MSDDFKSQRRSTPFYNWLSLAGGVVALGSFFAFILLFVIDVAAHHGNPYLGILAYVVAPAFLFLGSGMAAAGYLIQRRHARRAAPGAAPGGWAIDLSRPRDRRNLQIFIGAAAIFLLCTAIGSYQTYHMTESVVFCGQVCHEPMKPEFTAYLNGPHARVACTECHVGAGAEAFVQAKLNGVHQLLSMFSGDYDRPIKTPVANLRPAQETCEQCHWPRKFDGNLDRTYTHYLADETNTPFTVRLLLKVGGGDSAHGPAHGIHWHMSLENIVEYIATDDRRQVIPWVRVTNSKGEVTVYQTSDFDGDPGAHTIRRMDCIDCHNRPSHIFQSPNDAVDLALSLGKIDPAIPWIKSNAVAVLTEPYETEEEGLNKIGSVLRENYPGHPQADALVATVQDIFRLNFFPEMKTDWRSHPNNKGHKEWAGCFRCHDGSHSTVDGTKSIAASDCNACHVILAQGAGEDLAKLNPDGHTFFHIDSEYTEPACNICHTGGRMEF